jgi:TRAP-type C4-dicarboxylate transport system substrate-binding protein
MRFIKYFVFALIISFLNAKPIVIKLATLAPEGTPYYNLLLEMGQRWEKETNGKIQLRIYPNGVVGGEKETIRRMRIGQIQGSAMSSIGLAELTKKINAFTLPLAFTDYQDVESAKEVMFDEIHDGLIDSGFKLLFLVDIGWVYWFSKDNIKFPQDLKDSKIYTTAGDYVTVELFKKFGFNAVPVSENDILTGLQTGMINSMQTVPILALSSGWSALMPNMLDLKWGAFIGAVIIDNRVWQKISESDRLILEKIALDIGEKYQSTSRNLERKAIDAMKANGMNIITLSPEEHLVWDKFKDEITPDVIETFLSEEIYQKVIYSISND